MKSVRVAAVLAAALSLTSAAAQQPLTQAQQRPVFRAGTHFVRVDAYPVLDGKIVEGMAAEDFEILEDGKPQKIDSLDFVTFDTFTPEAERREGFDLAADPRYRLFVIFVDMSFSISPGPVLPNNDLIHIQQPLVNFLDRILGSQDLYGFLTSRNSVKDLVLARKSTVTSSQILDMWRSSIIDRDDADLLDACPAALKTRHRADATYSALEGLVAQLGSLRQERKNIVLATNLLPRWGADRTLLDRRGPVMPRVGIANGRLGTRDPMSVGAADETYCASEFQRLALMDFDQRYRELLRQARSENVSFYVITPGGLQAPVTIQGVDALKRATDDLMSLAEETDGIAIVNTNDLNGGMKKIADDMAAYYVLGYYTTNTKFDGGIRNIKVRYKANGGSIRARRQYRAPTPEEIAALSAPSPSARTTSAAPAASAVLTLVQQPKAYLVRPKAEPAPADVLHLARTDRIRVEWTVLGALDQRTARILDRTGKPLPFDVPLADNQAARTLAVELPLAPFARGDYSVELTVGSGSIVERSLLAFRVQ